MQPIYYWRFSQDVVISDVSAFMKSMSFTIWTRDCHSGLDDSTIFTKQIILCVHGWVWIFVHIGNAKAYNPR